MGFLEKREREVKGKKKEKWRNEGGKSIENAR